MKERMIYQVDDTRNIIISTAENIFTENGFFETQIKDIAEKSGKSRNTVYRYFQDKSDLAMAVIEKILNSNKETNFNHLVEIKNNKEMNSLEKFILIMKLSWMDDQNSNNSKLMAEFDAFYSGNRISPQMKKRFVKLESSEIVNLIVSIIDEGKIDGSIRPDIDSHLTFVTFLNALRSLRQRIILRGDVLVETTAGETEKMLPQLMELLIDGLKSRSEK